jgi:hypothetical protein
VLAFGNVVDLHGVNHAITGNDIWGMGTLLNSCSNLGNPSGANDWPSWRRGHAYSYIADNVLWAGQSSHFMQLWRQVIFERNVITGATEAAGGQSLGTGPMGGVAQHILHADNLVRFTWGGDREVMTYDDAGGAYYGPLAAVDNATLTLAGDAWPASDWEMGGWAGGQVYVINGTGATQIGRVLVPGVNTTAAPSNRTWVLAAPFGVPPATGPSGSWVQVMPFRGRNIFHRDRNVDTGPHQFYGHGVESIVAGVKFERVRGLIGAWGVGLVGVGHWARRAAAHSPPATLRARACHPSCIAGWGQWRGWTPPPPGNDTAFWASYGESSSSSSSRVGGLMGNGLQPNVRNVYRGNVFTEREHLVNYGAKESGYVEVCAVKERGGCPRARARWPDPSHTRRRQPHRAPPAPAQFWDGKSHVLYPVGALNASVASSPHPVHVGLTYRGEATPGGFLLGGDDADVLIEGATVTAAAGPCVDVSARSALVWVTGGSCAHEPA